MNFDEQRKLALKMAKEAGAEKTLEAIKNTDSCYADILKAAAEEGGLNKLVPYILQGDPSWAYNTLINVPNLGNYRDELIKKASETPETALHTLRFVNDLGNHQEMVASAAGSLADTQGSISGFDVWDQAGYNLAFTMYWTNNGVTNPSKIPPSNDATHNWHWSEEVPLGQTSSSYCKDFALSNVPLVPGNQVWIYLYVRAGYNVMSPFIFTYDPNTAKRAKFTASGTTTSPSLGYTGIS